MVKLKIGFGSLEQVEVISVRKIEGAGDLLAFVDIRIGGVLVITQCAVLSGKNGRPRYAILPRRLARDGRWRDVVLSTSLELSKIWEAAIMAAYEAEPAPDTGLGAHRLPQGAGLPQ